MPLPESVKHLDARIRPGIYRVKTADDAFTDLPMDIGGRPIDDLEASQGIGKQHIAFLDESLTSFYVYREDLQANGISKCNGEDRIIDLEDATEWIVETPIRKLNGLYWELKCRETR